MTTETIDKYADIIDSRDIIARIAELEDTRESCKVDEDTPEDSERWTAADGTVLLDTWSEDEEDEYKALKALEDEASGCADWKYGEALIRDSYFETYAEELADDIGAINSDARWPNDCIDWERAARELQQDYTSVDFGGITYWIRS